MNGCERRDHRPTGPRTRAVRGRRGLVVTAGGVLAAVLLGLVASDAPAGGLHTSGGTALNGGRTVAGTAPGAEAAGWEPQAEEPPATDRRSLAERAAPPVERPASGVERHSPAAGENGTGRAQPPAEPPAEPLNEPPAGTPEWPASGLGGTAPTGRLLAELRTGYQAVDQARRAYRKADTRLRRHRAVVARLDERLRRARGELAAGRLDAGHIARMQYRNSTAGLTPYVRMLLRRDPQDAFEERHQLTRLADAQALAVLRMAGGEQRLAATAGKARAALAEQRTLATERQEKHRELRRRLDRLSRLLAGSTGDAGDAVAGAGGATGSGTESGGLAGAAASGAVGSRPSDALPAGGQPPSEPRTPGGNGPSGRGSPGDGSPRDGGTSGPGTGRPGWGAATP
ncbi:hypothetical protein GL263_16130 [Streptomyces durbertensis]|uniref:Secreted protein n=1 Tax=Streptomyces durbertensis TaxID=2448886 RepID=A0ABR6EJE8_9ACTN|nr:hypothetical protein [Streptomyces durbertensis]MBB1245085.1 hypothetical protein [Streptomyces durbertensis]